MGIHLFNTIPKLRVKDNLQEIFHYGLKDVLDNLRLIRKL